MIDAFLCWSSVHVANRNPAWVTIHSMQSVESAFVRFHAADRLIEVANENHFYDADPEMVGLKSRVFLNWRKYYGRIKFVSKDCFTRTFEFEIDPDNKEIPLRVW